LPYRADVGDENVEPAGCQACNHHLSDEHNDSSHSADDGVTHGIRPGQLEAVLGSIAEVLAPDGDLDIGLGVDKPDDALHAGQEALQALDDVLEAFVALALRLGLPLHHLNQHLQELHNRQQKSTEGETAEMEPKSTKKYLKTILYERAIGSVSSESGPWE